MRRAREAAEHREALRRKSVEQRRKKRKQSATTRATQVRENKRKKIAERCTWRNAPSFHGVDLVFQKADDYKCKFQEPIKVCHVIESLGMGGGQTMMMELVKGLDKYYPEQIQNFVVCPRTTHSRYEKALYSSYGVTPMVMREKEVSRFMATRNVKVVVQHRLAVSKCLRAMIPSGIKYVIMNHTYHQLHRLVKLTRADMYVSVCDFLRREARWPSSIHASRNLVILNGVENDYLEDIKPAELAGEFKTGRCHRLVSNKFKADSLPWMENKVKKHIPGHRHYLIGHNADAAKKCKKNSVCTYLGTIANRQKKMSILKSLDVYFYETFGQEGASIAILESLACGVPVLCRDYGGNKELIKNGVNGYVLKDREAFLLQMKELQDPEKLNALKESTKIDFNERLHVRHTASKYMQIFEALL